MDSFVTARLSARKLSDDDLQELVALHLDPEVSRFLGGIRTPAATAAYLKANLDHWRRHGIGLWTLRTDDGAFVGRAGLRFVDVEGQAELEVAYTLVRSSWGQGIASEIAQALAQHWLQARTEPSLVGIVMKGNAPSERVLLKSGFRYERDATFHEEVCSVFRRQR